MPEISASISASVKEAQKDVDPAGRIEFSLKENTVTEYDAAKRLEIPGGESVRIDVDGLVQPRKIIGIEVKDGGNIRLSIRRAASENTDLIVSRFLLAEFLNVEEVKLKNDGTEPVTVRILITGAPL